MVLVFMNSYELDLGSEVMSYCCDIAAAAE